MLTFSIAEGFDVMIKDSLVALTVSLLVVGLVLLKQKRGRTADMACSTEISQVVKNQTTIFEGNN
jgi:hypothetical protein